MSVLFGIRPLLVLVAVALVAASCADPNLGPPSSTIPQALELNPTATPTPPFELPPSATPTPTPTPVAQDVTPTPEPEPEPDPGITEDTIRLAVVADVTTESFGFAENADTWDGMQAWAAAVNAEGGLADRRVELELIDTAFVGHADAMAEVCAGGFFALVGGLAVNDGEGMNFLLDPDCSLPDFPAAALSPQRRTSPITFASNPFLLDSVQVGPDRYLADSVPDLAAATALPVVNLETVVINSERAIEGATTAGLEFVYDDRVAFDADPIETAQMIVDSGARVLRWEADGQRLIAVLDALETIRTAPPADDGPTEGEPEEGESPVADEADGAQDQPAPDQPGDGTADDQGGDTGDLDAGPVGPEVVLCTYSCYSDEWVERAGPLGEGVIAAVNGIPVEEADTTFELTNFLFWLGQLEGDANRGGIALDAWAAGRLFEEAVNRAVGSGADYDPSALTHQSLLDAARTITVWDANGLQGVASPAERLPSPCFVLMMLREGSWLRLHPFGRGRLDCREDNAYELVDTRNLGLAGAVPTPEDTPEPTPETGPDAGPTDG